MEITASGRALTGGYAPFDLCGLPAVRGLRRPDAALRLPTISELSYWALSQATGTHLRGGAWIWGPGTSNMYRRSALALIHFQPKDGTYFRAADNYLCPFCHVFGGSALIDKQLSAYRIHHANYYAERESIHEVPAGRIELGGTTAGNSETSEFCSPAQSFSVECFPVNAFGELLINCHQASKLEAERSLSAPTEQPHFPTITWS